MHPELRPFTGLWAKMSERTVSTSTLSKTRGGLQTCLTILLPPPMPGRIYLTFINCELSHIHSAIRVAAAFESAVANRA